MGNGVWGCGYRCRCSLSRCGYDIKTHLSGHGLPSEELIVERATRRMEFRLKENAAIGYGLQRGRTFIRKAKSHKKLKNEK